MQRMEILKWLPAYCSERDEVCRCQEVELHFDCWVLEVNGKRHGISNSSTFTYLVAVRAKSSDWMLIYAFFSWEMLERSVFHQRISREHLKPC